MVDHGVRVFVGGPVVFVDGFEHLPRPPLPVDPLSVGRFPDKDGRELAALYGRKQRPLIPPSIPLRVKVEAKINSFQASTKTKTPVANREGAASGTTTDDSTLSLPAPSTLAASSTSAGSSRKKVVRSRIAKGKNITVSGTMAPSWVPTRPLSLSCTSRGTSRATGGKNVMASMMPSNPFEKGSPKRDRAYAAGQARTSVSTAVLPAMMALFARPRTRDVSRSTPGYESSDGPATAPPAPGARATLTQNTHRRGTRKRTAVPQPSTPSQGLPRPATVALPAVSL